MEACARPIAAVRTDERLSVELDNPSFVAPIYAPLVEGDSEGEDGHNLI